MTRLTLLVALCGLAGAPSARDAAAPSVGQPLNLAALLRASERPDCPGLNPCLIVDCDKRDLAAEAKEIV